MTPALVDIAEVCATRDAAVRLGREMTLPLAAGIAARSAAWAERAFAISGPLMATDPDAALAINRWGRRRLRAEVRRVLPAGMPVEGRADVLATADGAFAARLGQLVSGHIVVGGDL